MENQQIKVVLDFRPGSGSPQKIKQVLDEIKAKTGSKWRDCRRKSYTIHAGKFPAGYVYANLLEQPKSYRDISRTFGTPVVPRFVVEATNGAVDSLKKTGCYITSNEKVTLCGTMGEKWEVKLDKLASSYTLPDGSPIKPSDIKAGKWFQISRAGVDTVGEVGLFIPNYIRVEAVMDWGVVTMNDPESAGHGKGDILVFPKAADGGPDYTKSCSPINNGVFSLTFDQTIGGWAKSGCITSAEQVQEHHKKYSQLERFEKLCSAECVERWKRGAIKPSGIRDTDGTFRTNTFTGERTPVERKTTSNGLSRNLVLFKSICECLASLVAAGDSDHFRIEANKKDYLKLSRDRGPIRYQDEIKVGYDAKNDNLKIQYTCDEGHVYYENVVSLDSQPTRIVDNPYEQAKTLRGALLLYNAGRMQKFETILQKNMRCSK